MYQGKYLSSAKAPKAPKPETNDTPAVLPEQETPVIQEQSVAVKQETAPAKQKTPAPKKAPKEKKKKRIRVGSIIFYLLYFAMIGAAVMGIRYGYGLLEEWLVRFEASQPDTRSEEVFQEYFADPDWGWIYDKAGLEGTEFEGKEAYVTYMKALVGDQALTYSKTSAGLSGGHKYIVKLGNEKVATFTIQDVATHEATGEDWQNSIAEELELSDWQLDSVEAGFFTRDQDVTIITNGPRTITLNGIPLDESYVVKTTSTVVDSYLPEGIYGPRSTVVYASGFLVDPQVLVIDENGNKVELTYDADTDTYTEATDVNAVTDIPEAEKTAVLNATYSYCKHMIGATGANLAGHFDKTSAIYKTITKNELWFKGYARYDFSEATVTEYHRYTEDLFSARIQITLNTYRNDGSLKDFDVNTTLFLQKADNGKWLVTNMTNVDIHEVITQVRMTWTQDGQILSSGMIDASDRLLTPPAITVPEGQVFAGWFKETTDENGDKTLSLVFIPSETGTIALPDDYILEPMVLQARFEDKGE